MRLIIDAILTVLSIFAIIKLDWPVYLLVIPAYVLAMNAHLISWGSRLGVTRRIAWLLGLYGTSILVVSHHMVSRIPETFGSLPPAAYSLFFDTAEVRILWSLLGSTLLVTAGFGIVVALASLIAGFTMYHSQPQYHGFEGQAARSGLNAVLGLDNGFWFIENGNMQQVREPKSLLARFGGPGRVLVRLGNAVILEKNGHPSRAVGSGLTFLEPFERVSMIVPLVTRSESIELTVIETKDRAIIDKFEFTVFHKVHPGDKHQQIHDGPYVYNRAVLLNDVWSPDALDWRGLVRSVGLAAGRDVVGRYTLEELVPLSDARRRIIREDIRTCINAVIEKLGAYALVVEIGQVALPDETKRKLVDRWNADWEQHAETTRAETAKKVHVAEATARRDAIRAIAQGLKDMIGTNASPQNLISLRYIEYLEQRLSEAPMNGDQEMDTLMQLQALDTLRNMPIRRNP